MADLKEARASSDQWRVTVIKADPKMLELRHHVASICSDLDGSLVIVSNGMHTLLKVDPATGTASVIAGSSEISGRQDGDLVHASFNEPYGACVASNGAIYVSDVGNKCIRKIDRARGIVSRFVGHSLRFKAIVDGIGDEARFEEPQDMVQVDNDHIVLIDANNTLRMLTISKQEITTLISATQESQKRLLVDLDFAKNAFKYPIALCSNHQGGLLVADFSGHCVRLVDLKKKVIRAVIGDGKEDIREGTGVDCSIGYPLWLAASPVTGTVLIGSSANRSHYVFSQDKETGRVFLMKDLKLARAFHCSSQGVFYAIQEDFELVRIIEPGLLPAMCYRLWDAGLQCLPRPLLLIILDYALC